MLFPLGEAPPTIGGGDVEDDEKLHMSRATSIVKTSVLAGMTTNATRVGNLPVNSIRSTNSPLHTGIMFNWRMIVAARNDAVAEGSGAASGCGPADFLNCWINCVDDDGKYARLFQDGGSECPAQLLMNPGAKYYALRGVTNAMGMELDGEDDSIVLDENESYFTRQDYSFLSPVIVMLQFRMMQIFYIRWWTKFAALLGILMSQVTPYLYA